jgi:hypothetical protein
MSEPHGTDQANDRDGGTTLTDDEIETRPLSTGIAGPASSTVDDTGDASDTGDDSGDDSGVA